MNQIRVEKGGGAVKKIKIVFISLLIVALGVSAWFYAYHHRKSNDNLPTLAAIVEMDEADVNSLLMGYKRIQLREVWSEPDESSSNQDVWKVHEGASLVVNYNNKDIVVICAIPSVVELNRDQICEMAKEEFEEIFKDYRNIRIDETSIVARTDDMNHIVIVFEYSSDDGSGSYGFEYRDSENGSAKLVTHGRDVNKNSLLD